MPSVLTPYVSETNNVDREILDYLLILVGEVAN
jgi:hypothetical protein